MNHLNSIILEGNVTNDKVEVKSINDIDTAEFTISVNRFYKDAENKDAIKTSIFDIKCYGAVAEFASKNCIKNRGVRLVGRLESDTETSKVYVIAEHIEYKPIRRQ